MTPKEQLETLYKLHRGLAFPRSHPDRDVQSVHDRLIVYDAEIAGLVQRVLRGDSDALKSMHDDPELKRQIESLMARKPEAADLLAEYVEKYDRLAEMVRVSRLIH